MGLTTKQILFRVIGCVALLAILLIFNQNAFTVILTAVIGAAAIGSGVLMILAKKEIVEGGSLFEGIDESNDIPEVPQVSQPMIPQVSQPMIPQVSQPMIPQVSQPTIPQVSPEDELELKAQVPVSSDANVEKFGAGIEDFILPEVEEDHEIVNDVNDNDINDDVNDNDINDDVNDNDVNDVSSHFFTTTW